MTDLDILKNVGFVVGLQIVMCGVFSGMPLSEGVLEMGNGSLNDHLVYKCNNADG